MYEHRSAPLLSPPAFYWRMAWHAAVTLSFIVFSLGLGTAGYHYCGGLAWLDALLNAAMILTGMGPVDPMRTSAAKLFATFYSLYSGVAFLTTVAVLGVPLVHRFMHKFHLEMDEGE